MKFFFSFLIFLFFSLLLWIGIILGQKNNPSKTSQWVYDVYEKKYAISQTIKEKKVLILAGSNALFGVDSNLLSKEFGMKVLNYGVNAGVELPYTLHAAKKVLKQGDLVIMPLEYPMYSYDATPGVQMIDYIFSRDFAFFTELTLREQFYMIWHISFKRVWDGYFNQSKQAVNRGLYGAHNVDNNGDQINTSLEYRTNAMFQELTNLKANRYGEEFDLDAIGWIYLEKFVQWSTNNNIKVIFMPSTLMKDKSYYTKKKEKNFYDTLSLEIKNKGWEYVGNPYDYMYDKELYFNTDFHLINLGREKRTKQMIKDLQSSDIMF